MEGCHGGTTEGFVVEARGSSNHIGCRSSPVAIPEVAAGDHIGSASEVERALFQLEVTAGRQHDMSEPAPGVARFGGSCNGLRALDIIRRGSWLARSQRCLQGGREGQGYFRFPLGACLMRWQKPSFLPNIQLGGHAPGRPPQTVADPPPPQKRGCDQHNEMAACAINAMVHPQALCHSPYLHTAEPTV